MIISYIHYACLWYISKCKDAKKLTFLKKEREYFGNFFAKACQVIFGFILQSVNSSN